MKTKRPAKSRTGEIKSKPMPYNDLPHFNRFMNEILEKRTTEKAKKGENDIERH